MCTKRLTRELKAIQKNPIINPRVYTTPLEDNIREWHYVVEGPRDTPYEGGYYWGKLVFPLEYPMKPPSVIMLTPNGRFKTEERICLSISDFHPESWNPMWSVDTIIMGLISFMVETSKTHGSIESTLKVSKMKNLFFNPRRNLVARIPRQNICCFRTFYTNIITAKTRNSPTTRSQKFSYKELPRKKRNFMTQQQGQMPRI